jgi:hypothetical protein
MNGTMKTFFDLEYTSTANNIEMSSSWTFTFGLFILDGGGFILGELELMPMKIPKRVWG